MIDKNEILKQIENLRENIVHYKDPQMVNAYTHIALGEFKEKLEESRAINMCLEATINVLSGRLEFQTNKMSEFYDKIVQLTERIQKLEEPQLCTYSGIQVAPEVKIVKPFAKKPKISDLSDLWSAIYSLPGHTEMTLQSVVGRMSKAFKDEGIFDIAALVEHVEFYDRYLKFREANDDLYNIAGIGRKSIGMLREVLDDLGIEYKRGM